MPSGDLTRLGHALRSAREERRLTQDALADAADVSKKYISNIERGKCNPSYDILYRLVSALHISADILFEDFENASSAEEEKLLTNFRRCPLKDRPILLSMTKHFVDELLNR